MPGSDGDKQRAEDYADLADLRPDDFSMVLAILSRPHVWEKVERLAAAYSSAISFLRGSGSRNFCRRRPQRVGNGWDRAQLELQTGLDRSRSPRPVKVVMGHYRRGREGTAGQSGGPVRGRTTPLSLHRN